jgi:hypothetical protein
MLYCIEDPNLVSRPITTIPIEQTMSNFVRQGGSPLVFEGAWLQFRKKAVLLWYQPCEVTPPITVGLSHLNAFLSSNSIDVNWNFDITKQRSLDFSARRSLNRASQRCGAVELDEITSRTTIGALGRHR